MQTNRLSEGSSQRSSHSPRSAPAPAATPGLCASVTHKADVLECPAATFSETDFSDCKKKTLSQADQPVSMQDPISEAFSVMSFFTYPYDKMFFFSNMNQNTKNIPFLVPFVTLGYHLILYQIHRTFVKKQVFFY